MQWHCFQIELLGGPADGWQRTSGKAPNRTIRMPSSPLPCPGKGRGKAWTTGRHWAMYELLWRKIDFDAGGNAIVRMGYDFAGYRVRRDRRPTNQIAAGLLRIVGISWLMTCVRGRRTRLTTDGTAERNEIPVGHRFGLRESRSGATLKKRPRIRHP